MLVVAVLALALGLVAVAPTARSDRVGAAPSPTTVDVAPLGPDMGRAAVAARVAATPDAAPISPDAPDADGPGAALAQLVRPDVALARADLGGDEPNVAHLLGRILAAAREG